MANCPHGYPSPKSCVDCMADGPIEAPPTWTKTGPPFVAAFPGDCAACSSDVAPGDSIQRWDLGEERTRYTHADCGTPAESGR